MKNSTMKVLLSSPFFVTATASTNLVTDPSFEGGGINWVFQGTPNPIYGGIAIGAGVTENGYDNSQAGFINPFGFNPSVSQEITTTPGNFYLIEFFLGANGNQHDYSAAVSFGSSVGYTFDDNNTPNGEYSFVAQATGSTETFKLFGNLGGGTLFLDDVSITETTAPVPIPAAIWLFSSALAGFGVFNKRRSSQPTA